MHQMFHLEHRYRVERALHHNSIHTTGSTMAAGNSCQHDKQSLQSGGMCTWTGLLVTSAWQPLLKGINASITLYRCLALGSFRTYQGAAGDGATCCKLQQSQDAAALLHTMS